MSTGNDSRKETLESQARSVHVRSPMGKVLGLGAAGGAAEHWWIQRLTSVALIPLGLWFFCSLLALGSLDYASVHAWLAIPWHALATALLLLTLAWHSKLGVQVVVEDYVPHHGLKLVTLVLVNFAHVLLAGAGVFAVLRVAFGSVA